MERFPEELVDERNDWVRPEHRAEARVLGELHTHNCPILPCLTPITPHATSHGWTLPLSLVANGVVAENRRRQREEWLAARAARPHPRVVVRF
jgi:hypothetical protein